MIKLGLASATEYQVHGAQATGCAPISTAQKAGLDFFKPVKPNTIAKSSPSALRRMGFMPESDEETGGCADDVTDDEVREGIKLLAEHEGIFAETAGVLPSAWRRNSLLQANSSQDSVVCVSPAMG